MTSNMHKSQAADRIACSKDVPRGVFNKANDIWRHSNSGDYYGYSYKAKDPKTYAEQQLGKIFLNAAATHIFRAYKKVKPKPINVPENAAPLLLSSTTLIRHLLILSLLTILLLET